MARRKTAQELVRSKLAIAERLVALRSELYGERGGPELARRLNIPVRTWYNYERGITVPAEIILRIIKLTSVEAEWLLDGNGPKFAKPPAESAETASPPENVIGTLLRTALHLLENSQSTRPRPGGASVVSESANGSPAVNGVPALSQNQSMAHDGPWSEKSVTARDDNARPSRRQA
jgi:hypothetical protein